MQTTSSFQDSRIWMRLRHAKIQVEDVQGPPELRVAPGLPGKQRASPGTCWWPPATYSRSEKADIEKKKTKQNEKGTNDAKFRSFGRLRAGLLRIRVLWMPSDQNGTIALTRNGVKEISFAGVPIS